MIRISDYVTYREYNDQTFIIDIRQRISFHIKAPVGKLMDLFVTDTTAEDAKKRLALRYPLVSRKVLSDDVDEVVRFLMNNRLLAQESAISVGTAQKAHANTRHFQRYTIREKILYSALFEVTYRCPERCVHCYFEPSLLSEKYVADSAEELTTDEIANVLDQLAELNAMEVTFTGGEPFVRGDMFEILEYAHSKRFAIEIFSNGILLDRPSIIRLSKLRLHCFHSSIYSHIPEKHDHITGVEGSFAKTFHVLRELSDHGVDVNFKFVLMEQNKDDFSGVIDLARSIGATAQMIVAVSPSARGSRDITELSVRSDEDLRQIIGQWNMITGFRSRTGEFSFDDPICEAGRNCFCVNPYGIVTPCNAFHYEIGNVRKSTVSEIWNKSKKLKRWQRMTKRDLKGCQDCAYISRCSFCPGNALNFTGNMLKKYGEACRQAKIRYDQDE